MSYAAVLRREFPVERLPDIVRKDGSVSRSALKMRFSACGCPHANADVAAAAIKSGCTPGMAIQIAMLTSYYAGSHGPDVANVERMANAIVHSAKELHAQTNPYGKYAEDRAARLEGRPSRWGTTEFHAAARAGDEAAIRTEHYPFRTEPRA
jgi:hypothetical protein